MKLSVACLASDLPLASGALGAGGLGAQAEGFRGATMDLDDEDMPTTVRRRPARAFSVSRPRPRREPAASL